MPSAALLGLTREQLVSFYAHELAHVRRHDYLVNMLQILVETLLFYHPAVWWVSAQSRQEREHCCDDMAVRTCGDAVCYARALTRLERLRITTPAMAMGSNSTVPSALSPFSGCWAEVRRNTRHPNCLPFWRWSSEWPASA